MRRRGSNEALDHGTRDGGGPTSQTCNTKIGPFLDKIESDHYAKKTRKS